MNICFHSVLLHKHLKIISVAYHKDQHVHLSFPLLCSVVNSGQEQ